MEVRDKRVYALEAIARIYENIRPAGAGLYCPVLFREAFERAAGGRTDGDNAPTVFLCLVYDCGGLLRNNAELRVHLVRFDLVLLHRAKSAETYVQRHIADLHALRRYLFQQLLCEVQPRSRCSGAPELS